jgi:hypothetical protein
MHPISIAFSDLTYFQLSALLAGALFFSMAGLRELRKENYQGLLYLALSIFFLCIHGCLLWNLPPDASPFPNIGFWQWLIKLVAPALIVLFLLFGIFSLLRADFQASIAKILCGGILVFCLFIPRPQWPLAIQGILVLIWSVLWIKIEIEST